MAIAPEENVETNLSTRELILSVSTQLFARHGYDRVTMRDISADVGVTLPTIYHHFKDKENLYREVELSSYGGMKDRLMAALEEQSGPEDRLRAFIGELYDILNENPVFLNLALRNMLDPDYRHHKFLVGVTLQKVYEALVRLLNEFRPGSGNKTVPMAIISGIFGFVAMDPAKRQLEGYPYTIMTTKKERDEYIQHMVRSIAQL
jgi:AcrR family transcriptional regulator